MQGNPDTNTSSNGTIALPPALLSPLPQLQLRHEPGWRFTTYDASDPSLTIFDSNMDDFNLSFGLDVFKDGTLSNRICPITGTVTADLLTPDDLADLGNLTDRLQMWLDDCATVTQWAQDHIKELARCC